jgi:wyosine [tRNA(Phe)-imidazoG37] synthetase (radical SAM superfamily)
MISPNPATPPTPLPPKVHEHPEAQRAFTLHGRLWQRNRYVYPVVSRRSKGVSIGVNLNPDKVCNFDCIYCSVDRKIASGIADFDLGILHDELAAMLELARCGEIYALDPFDKIPSALQRINDIAFSGDGEPTTCPQFADACRLSAELRDAAGLADVKLVVISNATMFHRPAVQAALAFLDQHGGEIWAKLDAGTAEYYALVDRTSVPYRRVLENLAWCCRTRPTVIQSLFMRVHGEFPPDAEIQAYVARLRELSAGGTVKLVQVYTVARTTTEPYATALALADLESIAQRARAGLPGVAVEVYP